MQTPCPETLDFLRRRRSHAVRTLTAPTPDDAALRDLLTIAARSPDHGKLVPWRLVVLRKPALTRLAGLAEARGKAMGIEPERLAKGVAQLADADLAVAVIASPRDSDRIPVIEQHLSAGAVCLALLNASLAAGWGASWLTGWHVHDRAFAEQAFGVTGPEFVAGLIHIGTATLAPKERPRPQLDDIVTWLPE